MKFHEVLVLLRNLWVLVFIIMALFKWATQETKKPDVSVEEQNKEPPTPIIYPTHINQVPIEEKDIEEVDKLAHKPLKKIKPIVSFDHIKKELELEIIDTRGKIA